MAGKSSSPAEIGKVIFNSLIFLGAFFVGIVERFFKREFLLQGSFVRDSFLRIYSTKPTDPTYEIYWIILAVILCFLLTVVLSFWGILRALFIK